MSGDLSWTACARCAGGLAVPDDPSAIDVLCRGVYDDPRGWFPVIYCRKCRAVVDAEEKAHPVVPHMRCVHLSNQTGRFRDLYVREVSGDLITVGVLGLGGVEPERQEEILARCWPTSMQGRRTFYRSELLMKGF